MVSFYCVDMSDLNRLSRSLPRVLTLDSRLDQQEVSLPVFTE